MSDPEGASPDAPKAGPGERRKPRRLDPETEAAFEASFAENREALEELAKL